MQQDWKPTGIWQNMIMMATLHLINILSQKKFDFEDPL